MPNAEQVDDAANVIVVVGVDLVVVNKQLFAPFMGLVIMSC